MSGLNTGLTVVGGALALAGVLGVLFSAFRASDLRSTVHDQQARIEALKIDREELERDLASEKSRRELVEGRLALVEERCGHLEEIVSGRIDFAALETTIAAHHAVVVRRVDEKSDEIAVALRDIKSLLAARRAGEA